MDFGKLNPQDNKQPPTGTPQSQASPAPTQPPAVDQMKLQMLMQQIRDNQNLPMAILGGATAALVGAALWAAITVTTGWQVGVMAIGVGFLVGWVVRRYGQGVDPSFGIVGAVMSLLGCLAGNYLSIIGSFASEYNENIFAVLQKFDFEVAVEMMKETFDFADVIFYGLAVYYGYRYSIRGLTAEELATVSRK